MTSSVAAEALGHRLQREGDYGGAVIAYRKALSQIPKAETFHHLGLVLSRLERWGEALKAYEDSLSLRPFVAVTRNNHGLVLKEMGRLFEAEKVLRDLLADDPWNIDVATNVAGVLLEQGRPDVAIDLLSPIVRRAKHHSVGWDTLGACFLDNGDLDVALACFARAHEQAPQNQAPLFHLFAPLFEKDINQAIALLQHGLKLHPDRWDWSWMVQCIAEWHGQQQAPIDHTIIPPHWLDSWKYAIQNRIASTKLFSTTAMTLRYAERLCNIEGLRLEFGTRFGTSARILQEKGTRPLFAFDSFEGLPTAWHTVPKGAYSTGGYVPDLGDSIHPVVGWYSESLPPFIQHNTDPIRLLHIDCDLYSSTKDVFDQVYDRLRPGTVIIFDEYWNGPHWRDDEWKAWQECCTTHNIKYEYRAFTLLTQQAVIQIV